MLEALLSSWSAIIQLRNQRTATVANWTCQLRNLEAGCGEHPVGRRLAAQGPLFSCSSSTILLGIGAPLDVKSYLDCSVKLLGTCHVFKESFVDVRRYQGMHRPEEFDQGPKTFLGNALNFEAIMKKDEELDRQRQQRSRRENCSSMIMRKEEKISTLVSPDGSNSGSLLVAMSMETRLLLFLSVGFLSLPFWLNRQGLCPVYI